MQTGIVGGGYAEVYAVQAPEDGMIAGIYASPQAAWAAKGVREMDDGCEYIVAGPFNLCCIELDIKE